MSRAYRCRPSELLHIAEPLTAFYFDRAVFALASRIQSDFDALQGEEKAHLKLPIVLNKWGLGAEGKTGLADPASRVRK